VKTMEKEEEKAASEEKDHVLTENEGNGAEGHLPESENKEKETKNVIKKIQWVTANDFTEERGLQQIEELISVSDNSTHSGRPHLLMVEK
ncbi:PREDICTED: A-kinase anchor protein 14-like, partial [Acanthisitta chloris]|uniref:A-kinase anchor protein 14-like n=1 Tax=Acanthisitta chloris TaxID=57068 RepID=UPI0004F0F858